MRKHRMASVSTANINCFSGSRCLVRESKCCDGRTMSGSENLSSMASAVDIWRSCVSADCWRLDTQIMAARSREDFLNP
jgi:hypothetical protein